MTTIDRHPAGRFTKKPVTIEAALATLAEAPEPPIAEPHWPDVWSWCVLSTDRGLTAVESVKDGLWPNGLPVDIRLARVLAPLTPEELNDLGLTND